MSLLRFLNCIIAVWYGNKFKTVRIAADTLILRTTTHSLFTALRMEKSCIQKLMSICRFKN